MTMRAILYLLLILAGLTPFAPARAQEDAPGAYLGLSVGQTKIDEFCDVFSGASSCDDTDVGWKIFAGYQFNRFFAVEGGYVDLGKASASVSGVQDPFFECGTISGSLEAEAWGAFASAVATIPIGQRFGIFGKVGGAYTDAELTASGTSSLCGAGSDSLSDDGVNLTFGVGAKFDILRNLSIRAEWERFNDVGGDFEADVDLISAGVAYKF
jgi:OOP family OmpA-OmpF porin